MILLIIASFLLCHVLGDSIRVQGESTEIHKQHPWLVSIQTNESHICGGSIVSDSVILTAAHCTTRYQLGDLRVLVGNWRVDPEASKHEVIQMKLHENYKHDFLHAVNDVALLKVSPPIEFGKHARKVSLAGAGDVFANGTAISISSHTLGNNSLHVVDNAECDRKYASQLNLDEQICVVVAIGSSTCLARASGDPLMVGEVQVALVTEVFCVQPHNPKSYDRVAHHRNWIDENIRILQTRSSESDSFSRVLRS